MHRQLTQQAQSINALYAPSAAWCPTWPRRLSLLQNSDSRHLTGWRHLKRLELVREILYKFFQWISLTIYHANTWIRSFIWNLVCQHCLQLVLKKSFWEVLINFLKADLLAWRKFKVPAPYSSLPSRQPSSRLSALYGEITRESYLGRFYPACHFYWDILFRLSPLSPHFPCWL